MQLETQIKSDRYKYYIYGFSASYIVLEILTYILAIQIWNTVVSKEFNLFVFGEEKLSIINGLIIAGTLVYLSSRFKIFNSITSKTTEN